ncbi:MAG: SDR family NAD(P)-dependent oxidoreductase [Paracoccaceae bacterium]
MKDLAGRTAIVTGGLAGMGLAICHALTAAGVKVAAGSRSGGAAGPEGPAFAGELDVCDTASVNAFVDRATKALGPIDILVNAAGITAEAPVSGHSDTLWDLIIDTNLTGAFRMTRAVLPGMMARGWGRVINIGSTAATVGAPESAAYCASKAGLLGLTRCVALEGAAQGVTCVMVSPTWVDTAMMDRNLAEIVAREGKGRTVAQAKSDIAAENPQRRIIAATEVADLVTYLCSDAARGITSENVQLTGGATW